MKRSKKALLSCAQLIAASGVLSLPLVAQAPAQVQTPSTESPVAPPVAPALRTPQSGSPAGAQQPAGSQPARDANGVYTIRRSTRIVVLDVVVTDPRGNLVTDLKREDFTVTEAKEPQTILNFEQAGAHSLAPELTVNSTADLDRLAPRAPVNIILLDEFNTRFEDMAFARYSLKKFLEKQPEKLSTPTMLIAVGLQKFTVLHDYTQDKMAVLDALDHHFVSNPWQLQQGTWIPDRFATAFGTLMRVAEATVGHPGHKNMIWIGRGFPALRFTNLQVDAEARVNNAVQECVNMLRDARVTLYAIDPAGVLADPAVYGFGAALDDPFGGNYQFNRMATATGGRALYGRNDVDAEIGTSIRDGSSFYTLTYRPSNTSLDPQKFRRIRVTLDRPGLTATTREGYYLQHGPGRVDPQNPSRRLAFDLVSAGDSTMAYDGVPLTLVTSPTDPEAFTIHIDSRALSWSTATETEPRHADVILMTTTFDKKGKELTRVAKNIRSNLPATAPPTGRLERALAIQTKVAHDPRAVHARFVVRVTASGRIGTADADLGAPQPGSSVAPPE